MAWVYFRSILPILIATLVSGCATVPLDSARQHFYAGRLDVANQELADLPANSDKILNLMERGMIRHILRDYTNSTADWLEAVRLEKQFETHSVSKAGASMVVNDTLLDFRGYPYERTYLHVYLAKNYLAQGMWMDAGVEARSIAKRLENLDGFPDDALCHYIAALCFELCGDESNAAMQYRQVARISPEAGLDPKTGRFLPDGTPTNQLPPSPPDCELVCLLDFDGSNGMMPESADIYANGQKLGTSRTLVNILHLESESRQKMAIRKAAKSVSRLAMKGALAMAVSSENKDLGNLLWLLALASENEDMRRWETLPGKLAVARVPCPSTLKEFEVEFRGFAGIPIKRMTICSPLKRRGRIFVSLCRDHP